MRFRCASLLTRTAGMRSQEDDGGGRRAQWAAGSMLPAPDSSGGGDSFGPQRTTTTVAATTRKNPQVRDGAELATKKAVKFCRDTDKCVSLSQALPQGTPGIDLHTFIKP